MKLSTISAVVGLSFALSGCVIHINGQTADVRLQEQLSLEAGQLTSLEVESGAGDLIIKGSENVTAIMVDADIETSKERNYQLTLRKVGTKAVLVAEHDSTSGFWTGNSPRINLTVSVPAHLALDIEDSSGDLEISQMANQVIIDDNSGDITVRNIQGDLDIEDNSGDIRITNIGGNVQINDGSGEIWARDIQGNTDVDDGSGELTLHNINGGVTISDGSGDIEVINAGGLTILDSGSGDLTIEKVKGELNIDS